MIPRFNVYQQANRCNYLSKNFEQMRVYLGSFYPLDCNAAGGTAIKKYRLRPCIDESCRREPDFEHKRPAITGHCRPGFSKKLREGDMVIYLTNRLGIGGKRLVAILEVIKWIERHEKAAEWYHREGFSTVPNNLMVQETTHFPLDKTHRIMGWDSWVKAKTIGEWDKGYVDRAESELSCHVAICKYFRGPYLDDPYMVTNRDFQFVFKRIPGTKNPPWLRKDEWLRFQKRILPKLDMLVSRH